MNQNKSDIDRSIELLKKIKQNHINQAMKEDPNSAVPCPLTQTEGLTTKKNLPKGYTRLSVFCSVTYDEKIKAYIYWERVTMRDFINQLCRENLSQPFTEHDLQAIVLRKNCKKKLTIVMKETDWETIKALAWLARCTTRDIFAYFLDKFFANKEVSPIPNKSHEDL